MRMPRKARAAMNRAGLQDPEELKRRRKRFREMARAYKAEEKVKNIKRTAKDVGKELAVEAATAAAGGLAGKALLTGYRAYKTAKGAKKVAKGAQKMLKAGPERKLLMAPRVEAAANIAKGKKRPGKKRIYTTNRYADAPLSTPRTRTLESARYDLQRATEKAMDRVTESKRFADRVMGKSRRTGGSAQKNLQRRMDDEKQNYLKLKEAYKGRKYNLKTRRGKTQKKNELDAKTYKLNKSGKPPAPKPKAKRKKPAKRKAGAPVKETTSKPVSYNKKRKPYSEIRKNRAAQKNPQAQLRKAKSVLAVSKRIRRKAQKEMNEMQRKGTIEDMRRYPKLAKEFKDLYKPDNYIRRRKDTIKLMDEFSMPRERMRISRAQQRVKASAIKPRRR